jgi:uncharacterized protein
LNQRVLIISWNFFVVAAVLTTTAFVPEWGTVVGAAIALVLNRIGRPPWRCEIGLRKPRRTFATLAGGVLGGILLFFFIKLFLQHLCEIITRSQRDLSAFDFARGHLLAELPLIVRVALTAGFCEEVIFRGTLISPLENSFAKNRIIEGLIIFLSAAIFGAAHAYQAPAGILLTSLIALMLGYIYVACGRLLWPVILIHATYDCLSLSAISSNLDRVLEAWSHGLFNWIMPR